MKPINRPALVAALLLAGRAGAGVYDPAAPDTPLARSGEVTALPLEVFRNVWGEVIRAGVREPESDARRFWLAARAEESARPPDAVRLARLGMIHYRLREFDPALETLKRAEGLDPRNFWVLTHLGTVYQALGLPADAARSLEAAIDFFPADVPHADWYRRCEQVQLKLARLRAREQRQSPGRGRGVAEVDDLFGIRFDSAEGEYTVGRPREGGELPADAIAVVQQLLLWLPDDTRLYWQLGELYNAAGDVESALAVFTECLDARRFDAPKLRARRQAIRSYLDSLPEPPAAWVPTPLRMAVVGGVVAVLAGTLLLMQLRQWLPVRRDVGR